MKFLVTRVRHVLEGITLEAKNADAAIEASRKTKRSDWNHLDSKRRKSYEAREVSTK